MLKFEEETDKAVVEKLYIKIDGLKSEVKELDDDKEELLKDCYKRIKESIENEGIN